MDSGLAELEFDAEIPFTREPPASATLKRLFHHRLFLSGLGLFGIILLAAVSIGALRVLRVKNTLELFR